MNQPQLGKPADYGQKLLVRRYRVARALADLNGKTVLDFGCGNGAQTVQFANDSALIIGLDIHRDNLRVLRDYAKDHGLTSVQTIRYDGATIPLGDAAVDAAISFDVLEHVEKETLALDELYRVVKSGGDLVMSVPNKGWIFETHGAHLPLLPWNRVPFISWLPTFIHRRIARARIYRKRQIIRLLKGHGWHVLDTCYLTAPMDVVKTPWLKLLLQSTLFRTDTTRLPFLATAIVIHARKPG